MAAWPRPARRRWRRWRRIRTRTCSSGARRRPPAQPAVRPSPWTARGARRPRVRALRARVPRPAHRSRGASARRRGRRTGPAPTRTPPGCLRAPARARRGGQSRRLAPRSRAQRAPRARQRGRSAPGPRRAPARRGLPASPHSGPRVGPARAARRGVRGVPRAVRSAGALSGSAAGTAPPWMKRGARTCPCVDPRRRGAGVSSPRPPPGTPPRRGSRPPHPSSSTRS
mmetsp:Transcript_14806/g.38534  ORF Transcript_14806/g.38534 Transcript_14806/m.38534 type:complete len:227 (+) Transcript_14806:270-950(+)